MCLQRVVLYTNCKHEETQLISCGNPPSNSKIARFVRAIFRTKEHIKVERVACKSYCQNCIIIPPPEPDSIIITRPQAQPWHIREERIRKPSARYEAYLQQKKEEERLRAEEQKKEEMEALEYARFLDSADLPDSTLLSEPQADLEESRLSNWTDDRDFSSFHSEFKDLIPAPLNIKKVSKAASPTSLQPHEIMQALRSDSMQFDEGYSGVGGLESPSIYDMRRNSAITQRDTSAIFRNAFSTLNTAACAETIQEVEEEG